jgi:hypothetical protein
LDGSTGIGFCSEAALLAFSFVEDPLVPSAGNFIDAGDVHDPIRNDAIFYTYVKLRNLLKEGIYFSRTILSFEA